MTPPRGSAVFGHGRLRLYLLSLLAERPRHGYDVIRALERRFLGRYAPSAGTIYPRLQRLEVDGLVRHTAAGGRKVYEITAAGRAELAARAAELAELEVDVAASASPVAAEPDAAADLEQRAVRLLEEVRRLARSGHAGPEAVRATGIALDAALDQVRRLLL